MERKFTWREYIGWIWRKVIAKIEESNIFLLIIEYMSMKHWITLQTKYKRVLSFDFPSRDREERKYRQTCEIQEIISDVLCSLWTFGKDFAIVENSIEYGYYVCCEDSIYYVGLLLKF